MTELDVQIVSALASALPSFLLQAFDAFSCEFAIAHTSCPLKLSYSPPANPVSMYREYDMALLARFEPTDVGLLDQLRHWMRAALVGRIILDHC